MGKNKGNRTERELFHIFWENKWGCVRIAGSGSTPLPAPDLIAGKSGKLYAIECKSVKAERKYFPREEIKNLDIFAKKLGITPLVGIRFDREKWYFLRTSQLKESGNNLVLTKKLAKSEGIPIDKLLRG